MYYTIYILTLSIGTYDNIRPTYISIIFLFKTQYKLLTCCKYVYFSLTLGQVHILLLI